MRLTPSIDDSAVTRPAAIEIDTRQEDVEESTTKSRMSPSIRLTLNKARFSYSGVVGGVGVRARGLRLAQRRLVHHLPPPALPGVALQGYLAHEKQPSPVGPP